MRKTMVIALGSAAVLLVTSLPAVAQSSGSDSPPTDNGKWVGLVAFLVFIAVVGGMLFILNAYRKNHGDR